MSATQLDLLPAEDATKLVPVEDLFLDPNNPRIQYAGDGFSREGQNEILAILVRDCHLLEIVDSIIASGQFWRNEPLVVAEENGRKVVTEGNRRLGAVIVLLDPARAANVGFREVPPIDDTLRRHLQKLPVIIKPRDKVWEFIGFKHVNGPKVWDSISKARYIARVHDELAIPLPVIAKTIGDRNNTVLRLYHGLKVLDEAIESGYFDPEKRFYNTRPFAYSHLWTGLGYEGIRQFLNIKPRDFENPRPVPQESIGRLGQLCVWLYGKRTPSEVIEPYVKSQNPDLRMLDEAISSPRGLAALENGRPLEKAVEAAMGDEKLLRRSLEEAVRGLRDSRAYFSTGFGHQEDVIESIRDSSKLAKALERDLNAALRED